MAMLEVPLPCGGCGVAVTVLMSTEPRIINLESISIVLVEHAGRVECPACHSELIPAIAAAPNMLVRLLKVEKKEPNRIVLPGGPLHG